MLRVAATIARVAIFEPKTDRARRTVPLSPGVVAMLRKRRATQKADLRTPEISDRSPVWCSPPS